MTLNYVGRASFPVTCGTRMLDLAKRRSALHSLTNLTIARRSLYSRCCFKPKFLEFKRRAAGMVPHRPSVTSNNRRR